MMKVQLRDYQMEAVEMARAAIRAGAKNVLICAPTGAGKCLGRGTPVLMFDGSVKAVEDVAVGDALMGPDSKPRLVKSTTRGVGPLFRVTPKKGDAYVVNDAHILSLKVTGGATKWDCSRKDTYRAGKIHNITVTDYLSRSATFRHCAKGWRTGVEFQNSYALPLPAYFLGAWLGDGLSRGPAICSADQELIQAVKSVAGSFGLGTRIERQEGNRSVTVHITGGMRGGANNAVRTALTDLGLIKNKHIPHAYLTASREDRLELLAGLLDTDGHLSRGGYDFVQKNERLANEVAFLARSLGFAAYVSLCKKTCGNNGKVGSYYRISISGDCSSIPVRLSRRKAPPRLIKKDVLTTGLSVASIGDGEYFGFEIDGDRLFLLGDFTVTHNTVIGSFLIAESEAKGRRSCFVIDRLSLLGQTSDTFDRYGINHGIIQASHWRFKPHLPVQICSIQTVAKRDWPDADLILVDEAHTVTETVKKRIERRDCISIGLTATPFTKGLGKLYDAIINVTTTNKLIADGFLSKYKIFSCVEPDMDGVKVVAGEWESKETQKRALQVVGDVVQEYITHGQGRKFICSAVDTAHVEELQRQFLAAGINVATYTYKDKEEDRTDTVNEYRKPESTIRGIITVTAASKGFDVADIGCVIMARPLRKSLAEHIQFFGRGLRIADGKDDCLILDHSGNCERFWKDTNHFFEFGVTELDDGTKKDKPKEKKEVEKEPVKCPQCGHMHMPMPFCTNCGHEYPKRASVEHVPGTLKELLAVGTQKQVTQSVWPMVCHYARQSPIPEDRQKSKALALFKSMTGKWPSSDFGSTEPVPPTPEVASKIRSLNIAFAKSRQAKRSGVPA